MEFKGIKRETHTLKTLLRTKRFRRVFIPTILLIIPLTFFFYLRKEEVCKNFKFENINIANYLGKDQFLIDTNVGNITLKIDNPNNCNVFKIFDINNVQVMIYENNIQIGTVTSHDIKIGLPSLYNEGSLILADNLILVSDSEVGVIDGSVIGSFELDSMFKAFIETKKNEAILDDVVDVNRIIPVVRFKF